MQEYRIASPRTNQIVSEKDLLYVLSTINPEERIRIGRFDFSENCEGIEMIIYKGTVREAIKRFGSEI